MCDLKNNSGVMRMLYVERGGHVYLLDEVIEIGDLCVELWIYLWGPGA